MYIYIYIYIYIRNIFCVIFRTVVILRFPLFMGMEMSDSFGQRIQRAKHCVTTNDNRDADNSSKKSHT